MSFPLLAKTVYVTDNMKYTLRASESNRSKILKMIPSGTPLTVISENKETGYSKVRLSSGQEGYFITRHTIKKPISRWYLDKANKKKKKLQASFQTVEQELNDLKNNNQSALNSNQNLKSERDKLSQELDSLKQTASNAVQLKHQRDELQARVISVERELEGVKLKYQTLSSSRQEDFFLYGGLLALFGVIMGFILPKLSWRRKTSNWDTF